MAARVNSGALEDGDIRLASPAVRGVNSKGPEVLSEILAPIVAAWLPDLLRQLCEVLLSTNSNLFKSGRSKFTVSDFLPGDSE